MIGQLHGLLQYLNPFTYFILFYVLLFKFFCDTHVYALDLSNVPMLVPKANYRKKEKELYIAQLKAARTFVSETFLTDPIELTPMCSILAF